ncbi:dysbindin domain-containing protein 2 [Manis pentadactyla]|uniref:dysbindin domain-containing protein 2 n=1 Tax=Manis pentadactyla TaxID=143292 RepID=UPI00255CAB1B|nr:dysbindin domain-containing protein 2 [Manis pentadactyla]KAI5215946.1 Dysbindin Domain-Containing Protein 2 [Manis pentadactyla]
MGGKEEEEDGHGVAVQKPLDWTLNAFPRCARSLCLASTPSPDVQRPTQHPGVGSSPASRGAAQRPTPPALTRPVPAPTPPRTLEGWAAALSSPGAGNRGPRGADMDPNPRAALERQQLRLRERQKFFEDILQPETEFVFPLSHLHLESQRPPIGSISSMEVNVDTLEQVEFIDLGDQDGADVFLPCEDPPPTPQTSGVDDHPEELGLPLPTPDRTASRTSSSSSDPSTNPHSPNPSDGGADTPLAQSDEEGDGADGEAEPGACS